jgi:hypothetical protein
MSSDFDWLDGPAPPTEEETKELGWLFDDPKDPPPQSIVATRQKDPRFVELARQVRALPFKQRLYLKCLVNAGFNQKKACTDLQKSMGVKVDPSHASRWMRWTDLRKCVEMYQDLALEAAGLNNPTRTLLRIDSVVNDALEPTPKVFKGEVVRLRDPVTGESEVLMEVDRGSALKGLEMIGKSQGMFRQDEETQQRVTVVLDFSGEKPAGETESEAIEGDFTEVPK